MEEEHPPISPETQAVLANNGSVGRRSLISKIFSRDKPEPQPEPVQEDASKSPSHRESVMIKESGGFKGKLNFWKHVDQTRKSSQTSASPPTGKKIMEEDGPIVASDASVAGSMDIGSLEVSLGGSFDVSYLETGRKREDTGDFGGADDGKEPLSVHSEASESENSAVFKPAEPEADSMMVVDDLGISAADVAPTYTTPVTLPVPETRDNLTRTISIESNQETLTLDETELAESIDTNMSAADASAMLSRMGSLPGRDASLSKASLKSRAAKVAAKGGKLQKKDFMEFANANRRGRHGKKLSNIPAQKKKRTLQKKELGQGVVYFFLEYENLATETSTPANEEKALSPVGSPVGSPTDAQKKRFRTAESVLNDATLSNAEKERLSKKERARMEIVETEKTYVRSLQTLIDQFEKPMIAEPEEIGFHAKDVPTIFANVDSIHIFHADLLSQLLEQPNVAVVFTRNAEALKMYSTFLNGYEKAIMILTKYSKNKRFTEFLASKRDSEFCKGLDIMSYLIMPVQRIPRYELLLRELKRYTAPTDFEYADLEDAFIKIQNIAKYINENKRQIEQMSRLVEIEHKLQGAQIGFQLISPGRNVIKEGHLFQYGQSLLRGDSFKLRNVIMFTDRFLWMTEKFEFRGQFSLSNRSLRISDLPPKEAGDKHGFEVSFNGGSAIFGCDTEQEKLEWVQAILEAMDDL